MEASIACDVNTHRPMPDGKVEGIYSELVRYGDMERFDREYVNRDGSKGVWIYRNSDLRLEDTLNAAKDVETVAEEVRRIVEGREITAYNVGFDFGQFLYEEPWSLKGLGRRSIDIMKLATERVYLMAEKDLIRDKGLLAERRESPYPDKWVRSIDAYRVLCPEGPMGLEGMRHRALDDAVMEGYVLRALSG